MIASNSQKKVVLVIFCDCFNFLRKGFHQRWEDVSVENGERLVEFSELFWINTGKTDVTIIIDIFDVELGLQSLEETDFSELIRSILNTLFRLSLSNSGTEIGHSVYDSFFREGHKK